LKHYFDGRELLLEYAEQTLKHLRALWQREVVIETNLGGKAHILKLDGEKLKQEKMK
jgi:stage V sporulation protein R